MESTDNKPREDFSDNNPSSSDNTSEQTQPTGGEGYQAPDFGIEKRESDNEFKPAGEPTFTRPNNDSEDKGGKGGIITTIIIIVLAVGLIYYFNQGQEEVPEDTGDDQNVNITVNDTQEEGQVTITDQESQTEGDDQMETVKVTAYYNNTIKNPGMPDCSAVHPLEIEVEKKYNSDVINTVRGLLFPLDEKFTSTGWVSNFPAGTMLREVKIDNGVATANFTAALNNTAGSCQTQAVRAQITQTLLQFPYISSVVICVDDNCNDSEIIQP